MNIQQSTKKTGNTAEDIVVDKLKSDGFTIVSRNVWVGRFGEVDIVSQKGCVTHYIEVKSVRGGGDFPAEFHFNRVKHRKVIRLARFLANRDGIDEYQVDLAAVTFEPNGAVTIKMYEGINE